MDDSFSQKMMDVLNNSALALMISVGHRTRLFDVMADSSHLSSFDIANKASLNERYVREWLGAMVTSEIISYHPEKKTLFSTQ